MEGGNVRDNRLFINAIFWIVRSGAPWRDVPPDYGDWRKTRTGVFFRWRDKGIWERVLTALLKEPDFEWLISECLITAGTEADCSQACPLIEGINAANLLAEKVDDSDAIVKYTQKTHRVAVIPPKAKSQTAARV